MDKAGKKRLRKITLAGMLVAVATALQMLEAPLPRILPWLKIGLANVITLYSILRLGGVTGVLIAVFRTCLSAILGGSFLTPIHLLSFSGAVSSAIVMFFLHHFLPKTSICIISIFGAITSNIVQLVVVQFLFASVGIPLWFHLAMIIWIGIPSGIIVAKITYELLRRTQ